MEIRSSDGGDSVVLDEAARSVKGNHLMGVRQLQTLVEEGYEYFEVMRGSICYWLSYAPGRRVGKVGITDTDSYVSVPVSVACTDASLEAAFSEHNRPPKAWEFLKRLVEQCQVER